MKRAGGIVLAAVMTLLGVSACSSGSPSTSSCKILWADLNMLGRSFTTQSAATAWANQNDPEASNVGPVYEFTVNANQTVDVGVVTAAFYNGSGTEISRTTVKVGQTLTAGQSYTFNPVTYSETSNAPDGSATCQVVGVS
jgi:hypothetical protein